MSPAHSKRGHTWCPWRGHGRTRGLTQERFGSRQPWHCQHQVQGAGGTTRGPAGTAHTHRANVSLRRGLCVGQRWSRDGAGSRVGSREHHHHREGGKGANHPNSGWAGLAVPLLAAPVTRGFPTLLLAQGWSLRTRIAVFPVFLPITRAGARLRLGTARCSSQLLPARVQVCRQMLQGAGICQDCGAQLHCRH